jgi:hypothetical protein
MSPPAPDCHTHIFGHGHPGADRLLAQASEMGWFLRIHCERDELVAVPIGRARVLTNGSTTGRRCPACALVV